jgi:hypothetical protein
MNRVMNVQWSRMFNWMAFSFQESFRESRGKIYSALWASK